jgi:peptide chain release factor 3
MLIDSAKGVETQTRKLFQVCRRRGIPIFTFVNKMDRVGREPLDLLHEVEEVLGIRTCPINWPLGQGHDFKGVLELFDPKFEKLRSIPESTSAKAREEIELVQAAGDPFDHQRILKGELSPAFFGSAWTEVGVDEFLNAFVNLAPPPGPRVKVDGENVSPTEPNFSGFIFKIQANMDPAHRDRLAFLRVCSGKFARGMDARLGRSTMSDKPLRLSMPHQLFGADRHVIEEAWPGDVIGLFDTGSLRIGDTLAEGEPFEYAELPRFSPEIFTRARAKDALKRKQFEKGLEQLSQEGAIQIFHPRGGGMRDPILGAVGALQFEVLQYRLEHEYNALLVLERLPYQVARWVSGSDFEPNKFEQEVDALCVEDRDGNAIALFKSEWNLNYAIGRHPDWTWSPTAPVVPLAKRKKV